MVDVDNCLGKGLRRLLRQIVPNATLDEPVRVLARKLFGLRTRVRVRCTVGVALEGNGGHAYERTCGKPVLQAVVFRLASAKPSRQR